VDEPRILRFTPLAQQRPWGGRRLATELGRALPEDGARYGESWDLVDREEQQSVLTESWRGCETLHDLWCRSRLSVFGTAMLTHPATRFPLICKILDTLEVLSVQVHPRSEDALDGAEPKEECWWVLAAGPGSYLLAGTRPGTDRLKLHEALQGGEIGQCLRRHQVAAGDFVQVPSGTLHAIGPELLIVEIQQNSDSTYRLHDWGRLDSKGNPRELHLKQGLLAADPALQPLLRPSAQQTKGPIFDGAHYQIANKSGPAILGVAGEMLLIIVLSDRVQLNSLELRRSELALVPACLPEDQRAAISGQWLEIRLPRAG
jgi:mannose-6-phosphate isomerase